jgi:peroxiredoxin
VRLPDVALWSTDDTWVNLSTLHGRSVVFCYPYTGRPDVPDPPGWDHIQGAHGSTPQALGFSALADQFETLGVKIFGIGFQNTDWQKHFVVRNALQFPLLSDEDRAFSNAMGLKTFAAGVQDFLVRRTFVIEAGLVLHDFENIPAPVENARDVLAVLSS